MKKLFTILTVVILTTTISLSQDLTSKKGENYLPEGDEWSIGYDATSLLNYFGNFLNSNATAPTVESPSTSSNAATFYGKKIIDENSAWRARVELGFGNNSTSEIKYATYHDYYYAQTNEIIDQNTGWPIVFNGVVVTESALREVNGALKITDSNLGLNLWLGKEWRRGSTRLQGVYGAEVGLGFGSSKRTFDYELDAQIMYRNELGSESERITEIKQGSVFMVGARAFIGVEYFILPKISLGAEYGWGLALTTVGAGSTTTETTEAIEHTTTWTHNANISNAPEMKNSADTYTTTSNTVETGTSGAFNLGNDLRGSIAVNFYF